ncbi:MAG: LysM peptidoglycan-binding domain-containing protein [Clostridia bacterium]|nr:LysM peptidoglycan-binding domain-containing protein [Clostridia bacterium]MDD4375736.1 LysM peptidoglycan-binding domain-containing protein [Clostridia bacterium]
MKKVKKYKVNGNRLMFNIIFLLAVLFLFNILTSQIFGKYNQETKEIIVSSRDTLWGISNNICKKDSSLNVQQVVHDIKKVNNLSSSNIIEGQILQVPIYE